MKKLFGLFLVAFAAPAATLFYSTNGFLSSNELTDKPIKLQQQEVDLVNSEVSTVESTKDSKTPNKGEKKNNESKTTTPTPKVNEQQTTTQKPANTYVSNVQEEKYR